MDIQDLINLIPEFEEWNHAKKIKFFAWFLHAAVKKDRVVAGDIQRCYSALHLEPPSNTGAFLDQLTKRKPKQALKDTGGFYLVKAVRDEFESKYNLFLVDQNPKTETVLPRALVKAAGRGYLDRIVLQANGCYERGWYDGCSVLMRRLIETLIIEIYEANMRSDEIQDGSGNFIMLGDLLAKFLNDKGWNVQRETRKVLPEIKSLGDKSAHARRFTARQEDINEIIKSHRYRTAVEDLLHLAKLA